MKTINLKVLMIVAVFCGAQFSMAQQNDDTPEDEGYQFETIYDLPTTSVKDQHRSGTCWSFAGVSFLESEMMRKGQDPVDISEMFIVNHCYADKAEKYVRLHGHLNFSAGGAFHDVLHVLSHYGAMPETAYEGLEYGEEKHVHGEMDGILKKYVEGVTDNKNGKLSTSWHDGLEDILNTYMGEIPETFEYEGETYSPRDFADKVIALNADDYVQIASFTHHPFYEPFIIELPDNWLWGEVFNVKLDEMMTIINESLEQGYTVGWATDVSEKGFSHRHGIAVVPLEDAEQMDDTERARWEDLSSEEKSKQLYSFEGPVPEKDITQELRQKGFDNYQTTDDHGMHIVGMVKDQNGTIYYKVKNSWNTNNKYDGYLYASESFVELKTISIMVNKNAVDKNLRKKLAL